VIVATEIHVVDRVVIEEMGGGVELEEDVWCVPDSGTGIEPAKLK
jgi:hypothetical protein